MRVIVKMEIETEDFGSEEFQKEMVKLLANIDTNSRLIKFEMYENKEQINEHNTIQNH